MKDNALDLCAVMLADLRSIEAEVKELAADRAAGVEWCGFAAIALGTTISDTLRFSQSLRSAGCTFESGGRADA